MIRKTVDDYLIRSYNLHEPHEVPDRSATALAECLRLLLMELGLELDLQKNLVEPASIRVGIRTRRRVFAVFPGPPC